MKWCQSLFIWYHGICPMLQQYCQGSQDTFLSFTRRNSAATSHEQGCLVLFVQGVDRYTTFQQYFHYFLTAILAANMQSVFPFCIRVVDINSVINQNVYLWQVLCKLFFVDTSISHATSIQKGGVTKPVLSIYQRSRLQ